MMISAVAKCDKTVDRFGEWSNILNHFNELSGVWVRHIARTQGRADVRFAAHNGLNANVALCLKSANRRHGIALTKKRPPTEAAFSKYLNSTNSINGVSSGVYRLMAHVPLSPQTKPPGQQ